MKNKDEILKDAVLTCFMGEKLYCYNVLGSTNQTAKELAALGEKEGTSVLAFSQTSGRGRMGRSFYSPKDSGLYLSIILRPKIDAENSIKITTAAAVSVARVIEKFSDKKAYIKWVNDIFVDSKKVCGILTESVFKKDSTKIEYSVLGIGINLTTPKGGFPEEIKDIAGGIFESADNELKLQMAEEIINDFMSIYINLEQDDFYREYKNRSIVLGKEISFLKDGQTVLAKVADIDDKCRLVVEKQNGDREIISTGEVSLGSENFINN